MHPDASGNVPHPGVDCSAEVKNATQTWLEVGGRRIDNGDSYEDMYVCAITVRSAPYPAQQPGNLASQCNAFSRLEGARATEIFPRTALVGWVCM